MPNALEAGYFVITGEQLTVPFHTLPDPIKTSASAIATAISFACCFMEAERPSGHPYSDEFKPTPTHWGGICRVILTVMDKKYGNTNGLEKQGLTPYQLSIHLLFLAMEPSE